MNFGIAEVYYGDSGKIGYYNNQQVGLSRAMKKLGYKCFIFLPDINLSDIKEEQIEEDITVVHCPAKTIGVNARYDWSVLKKYNTDILQVGSDNHLFAGDLLKYCDMNGIKAYNYFGTVISDNSNKIKRAIVNLMFERNIPVLRKHMSFTKTEKVKQDLESLGFTNLKVVPIGLDTSVIPEITATKPELRLELGIPIDKKILLYVGRIDTYKRPEMMLSLVKDVEDSYGIMIGDGSLSGELEKKIKTLNLQDRIKWIKKLPNDQVHSYYAAADYFVNFNDHEIFGMSILEAMYQGCTVIAFHAPGPDTIIENGVSGYLVDGTESMKNIVKSNERLSVNDIKAQILKSFTWNSGACVFDEFIKTIVAD